jgi:predicted RNA-binding protein YlxR (DUF448 family)
MVNTFVVTRLDVVSHKPFPRDQLLRLVITDKKVVADPKCQLPGRGIYVKKEKASIHLLLQKGFLRRYGVVTDPVVLEEELSRYAQS